MITVTTELNKQWDDILYYIAGILFCFSLFWSTAIAIFSYKALTTPKNFNSKGFLKKALIYVCLITMYGPLLVTFNVCGIHIKTLAPGFSTVGFPYTTNKFTQYLGWFLIDIVALFFPIFIIFYCYYKVYKALKVSYDGMYAELSSMRVFIYVLIPTICFLPWHIADFVAIYNDKDVDFVIMVVIAVFRRAWGFLNLLAYWFLSPGYKGGYSEVESEVGLNDSIMRKDTL